MLLSNLSLNQRLECWWTHWVVHLSNIKEQQRGEKAYGVMLSNLLHNIEFNFELNFFEFYVLVVVA